MNREILFKAKRKDNGKWVEGYYVKTTIGNDVTPIDVIFVPFKVSRNEKWGWIKIDSDTLCQFTGLTDKNDQKIWENDILHRAYHAEEDCIVQWHDGSYRFKTIHGSYRQDPMTFLSLCFTEKMVCNLKVIGNIFDNVDLLEVE